ncbi:MAG: DUF4347 domain-containing protein [Pegethrix bostrychoides GSE-TBD4-15B]|jgi:Ca2+-binding RTX toxin-like protein|uniref:DUF4347 domain-containing protein n=1 Tax=Pegethrix bostrychoides GSE-TBD4-15B TaxID=2839662 RepID=A0A951PC71_9CYAN|nr:DUF4347 domain-containing protein [Pegethrix bostrychoides GSE-TBD4-15B]
MTVREFCRSLLVVDPTVVDYPALLAGVETSSVLILDPNRDGVEQITQALAGQAQLDSLQILSHGQAGAVRLGNSQLSLQSLQRYVADLAIWAKALAGAEILLYGCEVAAGQLGRQFLHGLKALVGAEIAASATPVGSAALGGSWNLNVTTGSITVPMLIAAEARATYAHSLITLVDDTFREATVANPNWLTGVGPVVNPASPPQQPFLTASSSPTGVIPGSPTGAIDAPGDGALRLTNSVLDQASFLLYNSPIDSRQGLTVTFELYAYGGTGADGVSFFLLDGTASPTQAGAFGGSLGYAQKNGIAPGIDGGYLGIGFDEFGNFSSPTDFPGGPVVRTGGSGQLPDSIAIRAGQSTNYQFIPDTATSLPFGIDNPAATTRVAAKRTIKVDLTPEGRLSVRIDGNNDGDFLDPGETSPNLINIDVAGINGAAPPTTLKFGFASGTGDSTNIHEIRNLVVSTLNQEPIAADFAQVVPPSSSSVLVGFSATDPDIADGDSIASFSILTLPPASQGVLYLGDPAQGGTPIAVDATLTPAQIQTVYFQATAGFTASNFTYTATDSRGSSDSTPASVTLSAQPPTPPVDPTDPTNPGTPIPPVTPLPPATGDNLAPDTAPSSLRLPQNTVAQVPGLSGSDPDGTVVAFSIRRLPPAAQGTLYLGNPTQGGTPIAAGQILTPDQIQQVFFQSSTSFSGAQFTYAAIDNQGAGDQTPAVVRLTLASGVQPAGCLPGREREGNDGDNSIKGGRNIDQLAGNGGDDRLSGLACNDVLQGGRGADNLLGGGARDRLDGQQDNDRLAGNSGDDFLNLGLGDDRGSGDKGNDVIYGRRGNDLLQGKGGNDELLAGRGNDEVNGGTNQDFLDGQQGDDQLQGAKGRDVLNGGLGDDRARGGRKADQIAARRGDDVAWGGSGRDLVLGQRGNDKLAGNSQADRLNGGLGNDVLIGGPGNDRLRTGKGSDRIVYRSAEHGVDTIIDFDVAQDVVDLRQVFDRAGYGQSNRFEAYVRLGNSSDGAVLRVDSNGDSSGGFLQLAVFKDLNSSRLTASNFLV